MTMIKVSVDNDLSEKVNVICQGLGITLDDYIRLSFLRLVEEKKLPDNVLIPNDETIQAMSDLDKGKGKKTTTKSIMSAFNKAKTA